MNCKPRRIELPQDCWSWIYQQLTLNETIQLSRTSHQLQAIAERRASHRPFPTFPTATTDSDEMEFDIMKYHAWNRLRETVIMTPHEFIHVSHSRVMQHIQDVELLLPCGHSGAYFRPSPQQKFPFQLSTYERDLIEACDRYKSIRAVRFMLSIELDEMYVWNSDDHHFIPPTSEPLASLLAASICLVDQLMAADCMKGLISFEICTTLNAPSFEKNKVLQCLLTHLSQFTNILHVSIDLKGEQGLNHWLPTLRQIQFASNRGVLLFTGALDATWQWDGQNYAYRGECPSLNPSLDIFPTSDGHYVERVTIAGPDQVFVRGGKLSDNSIPPTHILLKPLHNSSIIISPTFTRHLHQTRIYSWVDRTHQTPFQPYLKQFLESFTSTPMVNTNNWSPHSHSHSRDPLIPPLQSLELELDGCSVPPPDPPSSTMDLFGHMTPFWLTVHNQLRQLTFRYGLRVAGPMAGQVHILPEYFLVMLGMGPRTKTVNPLKPPSSSTNNEDAAIDDGFASPSSSSSSSSSSSWSTSFESDDHLIRYPYLEKLTLFRNFSPHARLSLDHRYSDVFTNELCHRLTDACPSLNRLHLIGFVPSLGQPFLRTFTHLIELSVDYELIIGNPTGDDQESFTEMLTQIALHLRQLESLFIFLKSGINVKSTHPRLSNGLVPIILTSSSLHQLTLNYADPHFFASKRHYILHQPNQYATFLQLHLLWSMLQPLHQIPLPSPSTHLDPHAHIACLIGPLLQPRDRHLYHALSHQRHLAAVKNHSSTGLWSRLQTHGRSLIEKLSPMLHRVRSFFTLSVTGTTHSPPPSVQSRHIYEQEFRAAVDQFLLRHQPSLVLSEDDDDRQRPPARPPPLPIQTRHFNLRLQAVKSTIKD